ncbi:MAG: hypothetical protein ACVCEJ_07435 [Candidatus Izemoplasmataceae bacterium]
MKKIPTIYFVIASIVLLLNMLGYYLPFVQNNITMTSFYLILLPFQLSVFLWFLWLVYRNAPLNENISIFMVVYFFLQAPFIVSFGLRDVNQLDSFVDMMTMVVIGFTVATLFILTIVDIWPKYVSLTVFALLVLRFLNVSWMNIFELYRVDSEVVLSTIVYTLLGVGVIFLEAYTLYRFYELEE